MFPDFPPLAKRSKYNLCQKNLEDLGPFAPNTPGRGIIPLHPVFLQKHIHASARDKKIRLSLFFVLEKALFHFSAKAIDCFCKMGQGTPPLVGALGVEEPQRS